MSAWTWLLVPLLLLLVYSSRSKKKKAEARALVAVAGAGGWIHGVVETLSFLRANSSARGLYCSFVEPRRRRYGFAFRTALFGHTHVFLLSASASASARRLLGADPPDFSKRYVRTVAELLGEHSLLCSSHATHHSLRRALAPLFTSSSASAFAAAFDRLVAALIARHYWPAARDGRPVVVLDGALSVTFQAICAMLIGHDSELDLEQLRRDVAAVTQAMLALPVRLPGTRFYRGLRARKRIMAALQREINSRTRRKRRREDAGSTERDKDDFLNILLLLKSSSSESLTEEQILDNILTLIIAGQVTTAAAITWMVKHLDDNTDFQETLRSVQLEFASKHRDLPLTLHHLNTMDFAYKAVKESLRMATIVSWFPRVALKDSQLAGFHIEKDWIVNIDARSIHYDPTIYSNPTLFDPSRFNEEMKPYSFLVFGAGGRTCLGMNLAKIMMLIFLHRLVTTFRWEMADQDTSLERWAMFPRLKNGCPIKLTPIHNSIQD